MVRTGSDFHYQKVHYDLDEQTCNHCDVVVFPVVQLRKENVAFSGLEMNK